MNRNLIAALNKNAETNANGTNPVNYRKYIYDTQFNILDTFKSKLVIILLILKLN